MGAAHGSAAPGGFRWVASPSQQPDHARRALAKPLARGGGLQLAFTCGKFTVGGRASDSILVLAARDGKPSSDLIGMVQGNIDSAIGSRPK